MAYEPHNLLVTGGVGFIGVNFVRQVLAEHPETHVVILDSLTYAANPASLAGLDRERFDLVRGDVCDPDRVASTIEDYRVDCIVHFAAESHNDNSIEAPDPFIRTNIYGTYIMLQAARRYGLRFHQVSTDEVYGDLDYTDPARFTEESPYRPSSPYSASKAAADQLVRAWWRTYGTQVTISNCSNNYGPYQHVEKFIPRQITNILSGRRPRLYGEGKGVRDWIHVDDDCRAIWDILTRGRSGRTYLIGADGEHSDREVLGMILQIMGRPAHDYDLVPDRLGADRRYAIDASRIRRELGWRPRHTDFAAGLEATVDWYRTHQDWWRPGKERTEERCRVQGH
ncbi:dTDP-glucose 4,6-dehydratase [Bifidobacterium favimelis]|uniref:dTDP-glucose 4,6-dehydratase n=1 Tax=Bifidobacterium favimelis TaxID=3122979 RepID=A0ABU8ZPC5_9BIFI